MDYAPLNLLFIPQLSVTLEEQKRRFHSPTAAGNWMVFVVRFVFNIQSLYYLIPPRSYVLEPSPACQVSDECDATGWTGRRTQPQDI